MLTGSWIGSFTSYLCWNLCSSLGGFILVQVFGQGMDVPWSVDDGEAV